MSPNGPRLGLFGGAFDPPHRAHQAVARAAIAQVPLDRLYIVPTGAAGHRSQPLTDGAHRLAMARLAFADIAQAAVDPRELNRPGTSYSIDTLRELQAQHPGAVLHLVLGEDQARAFTTWRDWSAILALATLCVAPRPSGGTDADEVAGPDAQSAASAPVIRAASIDPATLGLPAAARVLRLQMPPLPHSATAVRQRLAHGLDVSAMAAPEVARYIDQHHLYSTP